jgi:hypothetical protein
VRHPLPRRQADSDFPSGEAPALELGSERQS